MVNDMERLTQITPAEETEYMGVTEILYDDISVLKYCKNILKAKESEAGE